MLPQIKTNPNTKTISIEARPMWETKHYLNPFIKEDSIDRQRIDKYREAKEVLDTFARKVIERATQYLAEESLDPTYERLEDLFINVKDAKTRAAYRKACNDFKKYAAGAIKYVAGEYQLTKEFGKLFNEDKSAIYKNAELFGMGKETLEVLKLYDKFTSYFNKYFTSLSDVILCGTERGSIAYRIMENMECFWSNKYIIEALSENQPQLYISIMDDINNMHIEMCMTQEGIDAYNILLGNTSNTGINSIISSYAQKNHVRIKQLKTLKKIPLAQERKQIVIQSIDNDEELGHVVLSSVPLIEDILSYAKRSCSFHMDDEIKESTYFKNKNLNVLSHLMYGKHNILIRALQKIELSEREKDKLIVSVSNIDKAVSMIEEEARQSYMDVFKDHMTESLMSEKKIQSILRLSGTKDFKEKRGLIKDFYDPILHVNKAISLFYLGEIENTFIEDAAGIKDTLVEFNKIYNMVRNYCTQNPVQKKTYDMFFNKGTFLSSFDSDKFKEGASLSTLLRKDGMYYLYILNPEVSTKLSSQAYTEKGGYDRLVYKQLPGVNKNFPNWFIKERYEPTEEIIDIVKQKKYTKEAADRESCVKWIQFCIDSFKKNEEWMQYYNVPFKKAEEYESANDFYTQIEKHTTYMAWSEHLDEDYVRSSVAKGEAFLFQLYNHDFSPSHTGKDGNYTRILKELFSDENIYKINENAESALKLTSGGAKLTYREASVSYKETHEANETLNNKNYLNAKKTSRFSYSLCKNKRFTRDAFTLYLGVQMGYRNEEKNVFDINRMVNEQILKNKPNILTVRAGEEHLLYYIVSDPDGNILGQGDLNVIETHSGSLTVRTDFKSILKKREEEMKQAKEVWNYSVDIKDVKKGYVACAVRAILDIREKYDAVILLEDYSGDFVNSRRANVKTVYQQFQTALLNKMSCYIPEGKLYSEAIQLAAPASSLDDLKGQKEIVFFVNPSYTSNVDHTSGFCNQFYDVFSYENKKKADEVCKKLDVQFADKEKEFLICLKEDDFGLNTGKEWILHTSGDRTVWKDNKLCSFNCTEELADLMREYHLSEFKDYKAVADKAFYEKFFIIMKTLLKMHYSSIMDGEGYFISPVTGYDTRGRNGSEAVNSSAVKTLLIMQKGIRDINNIDEETLMIKRDEKGTHKEKWLHDIQQRNHK